MIDFIKLTSSIDETCVEGSLLNILHEQFLPFNSKKNKCPHQTEMFYFATNEHNKLLVKRKFHLKKRLRKPNNCLTNNSLKLFKLLLNSLNHNINIYQMFMLWSDAESEMQLYNMLL